MKVGFFTAHLGPGVGGHLWDLRTTAESLTGRVECVIVVVGDQRSPVIEGAGVRSYYLHFNLFNIFSVVFRALRIAARERFDVIHVFENSIFFLGRLVSLVRRKPLVLTKCGGPPPEDYYPYADNVIVVSKQDHDFFRSSPRFTGSQVHLWPNRIRALQDDPDRVRALQARFEGRRRFLMIARLIPEYRDLILQGVALVRRLNAEGHSCRLIAVGVAQNRGVWEELRRLEGEDFQVLSDDRHTRDASRVIEAAEFTLGYGRVLMEGAAKGKVLLTYVSDSRYPLLVDEETFPPVFETNFSPRNRIPGFDEEANYEAIARAVSDPELADRLRTVSRGLFHRHFAMDAVLDEYEALYRRVLWRRKLRVGELMRSFVAFVRSFAAFYLRDRKMTASPPDHDGR